MQEPITKQISNYNGLKAISKLQWVTGLCVLLLLGKAIHISGGNAKSTLFGIGAFAWLALSLFYFSAVLLLLPRKISSHTVVHYILGTCSLILLLMAYNSFVDKGYQFPQLIELTIQWALPLIWVYLSLQRKAGNLVTPLKIMVALTFVGHGLYALGFPYGQPENFIYMTKQILPLSDRGAGIFLQIAGILDILLSLEIFIKGREKYFLYYAIFWGFLTAFARVVAYVQWDMFLETFVRWAPETMFRLGHGGIPLLLFWIIAETQKSHLNDNTNTIET